MSAQTDRQSRPRVFVTQEQHFDYSPAEVHGDLEFLAAQEYSPSWNSLRNSLLIESVRKRMVDYIPQVDFLLPSGSPLLIGLVFAIAAEKGSRHNVLHYSNRDHDYRLVDFRTK